MPIQFVLNGPRRSKTEIEFFFYNSWIARYRRRKNMGVAVALNVRKYRHVTRRERGPLFFLIFGSHENVYGLSVLLPHIYLDFFQFFTMWHVCYNFINKLLI